MLTDQLFVDPAVSLCLDERAALQGMLDFEAALARAEAACGVIPASAATAIGAASHAHEFDPAEIARGAAQAGNVAIPLVRALTIRVATADAEAARYVHWGATSQDAIDTGLVLQLRAALTHVGIELAALEATLAVLAERHRESVMVGRTWLQPATPTTFGRKVAGWLTAVRRTRTSLERALREASVVQFGGASGTLAALGDRGLVVAELLARELDLALPALPWHAERDRFAALAAACGNVRRHPRKDGARSVTARAERGRRSVRTCGARARRFVDHAAKTQPRRLWPWRLPRPCARRAWSRRSSPHCRKSTSAASAAGTRSGRRCPISFACSPVSARAMAQAFAGLEVDPARMRANLELTQGFVMAESFKTALAASLGLQRAHEVVEAATRRAVAERLSLREALEREPLVLEHLSPDALERAGEPRNYLGVSGAFVRRALAEEGSA